MGKYEETPNFEFFPSHLVHLAITALILNITTDLLHTKNHRIHFRIASLLKSYPVHLAITALSLNMSLYYYNNRILRINIHVKKVNI